MLSAPLARSCRSCCIDCCSVPSPRRTPGSSSSPSAVRVMLRPLRRKSGTRRYCSSARICRLTAAGVTCSASAASVKLRCEATLSNTRSPFRGSLSKPFNRLVFLNDLIDIAFADPSRYIQTVNPQIGDDSHENQQLNRSDLSTPGLDRWVCRHQFSLYASLLQPCAGVRRSGVARLVGGPVAVRAEIEFLLPGAGRPFTYGHETPPGAEPPTARFAGQVVEIRDVRGGEPPRLEEHGAKLGHWPTQVRYFNNDAHLRARYYPESAEIIRAALGADRVVVFDHNVRLGGAADPRGAGPYVGRPVHHAHTDYTPRTALQRLRQELGPRAEVGLSRYLQVNLWRPIRGPVRDAPLALCDGASVAPRALHAVELRYPDRTGEIFYL